MICPLRSATAIRDIRTWVYWRNNVDVLCSLCATSFSLFLSMLASNLDNSTEKTITKQHWNRERQVSEQCDPTWMSLIVCVIAKNNHIEENLIVWNSECLNGWDDGYTHSRYPRLWLIFFFTGNRVLPGRVYKFEGWTKLLDRKRTGDIHSLELWLRYKKRGDKEQKNKLLAKRTKYSQGKYE